MLASSSLYFRQLLGSSWAASCERQGGRPVVRLALESDEALRVAVNLVRFAYTRVRGNVPPPTPPQGGRPAVGEGSRSRGACMQRALLLIVYMIIWG